jgi:hypothetical protein
LRFFNRDTSFDHFLAHSPVLLFSDASQSIVLPSVCPKHARLAQHVAPAFAGAVLACLAFALSEITKLSGKDGHKRRAAGFHVRRQPVAKKSI